MDPTAFHLIVQLLKRGDLDLDDIGEIAGRLAAEGEEEAAHAVRAAIVEAGAPSEAEQRRARMAAVPVVDLASFRTDGGNEPN